MDQLRDVNVVIDLFESSGIGLLELDADNHIRAVNQNAGIYLGLEPGVLLGHEVSILRTGIRSAEFWSAFPGTFYCLAPGPQNLLLIVSRRLGPEQGPQPRRAIILRPYSLEREFGRMRVCLNNFLAHEIATRLNSISIASEFITEPELRENLRTRAAFISTFRHDITDLNTLFVQLLETADKLAMPNRVVRMPVDWSALVEDLAAKIRGLACELSVSLTCHLPPHLPAPSGDYHWLYLGLFAALAHALRSAVALSEVTVAVHAHGDRMETIIEVQRGRSGQPTAWPPPALFPLDDAHPRIGRLAFDELAVTRLIFLQHAGDLRIEHAEEHMHIIVDLPV